MDTVVTDGGSLAYRVLDDRGQTIAEIGGAPGRFHIQPRPGSILDGMSTGPYSTLGNLMRVISDRTGGKCERA